MDKKVIREYIKLFKESGLAKLEIEEKTGENSFSIRLENAGAAAPFPLPPVQFVQNAEPDDGEGKADLSSVKDYNKYRDVKSPMVGIFYARRRPTQSRSSKWAARSKRAIRCASSRR